MTELSPNVLVVEDEALIRIATVKMLQDVGGVVLQAGDPDNALKVALTEKPVCIVLDINLGAKKNGIELAREIRQHYSPHIFISTAYEIEDFCSAEEAGSFSKIFSKPLSNQDIEHIVSCCSRPLS